METFGIMGFMFGTIAFVMVTKLTKEVKTQQEQMEDVKKRVPPAQDSRAPRRLQCTSTNAY